LKQEEAAKLKLLRKETRPQFEAMREKALHSRELKKLPYLGLGRIMDNM